ncbi:MAG: prolipoprotein diacylglyceryl transferase [Nitrospinota bacterium]
MYPVLFEFGPVVVRFYGLMYVIALIVGIWLVQKESLRLSLPLSKDDVANYGLYSLIAGVVGGRIYYVVFNWPYYAQHPLEIPAIWRGGLAIHGGIIAGFLFSLWYTRRRGVPFWRLSDAVAPALILGQAFGRIGNFMNGDAHGVPTKAPWGIVFPETSVAGYDTLRRYGENLPLHPTMLYELLFNLAWFALLWGLRKRPHKDGFIFASYLILYSGGRFVVSFFRADSLMLGGFRAAHVISILLIAVAGLWIASGRLWKPASARG